MKRTVVALVLGFVALSANAGVQTIEEYNKSLIEYGVSWRSGSAGYYPSFYTGFAPRVEDPNRIHFHLGRGNNARLTAQLDEYTLLTYFYNLKKRADVHQSLVTRKTIVPWSHNSMESFNSIVDSPVYGIRGLTAAYESGSLTREALYQDSLNTLKLLNPGRIFEIRVDFTKSALTWRDSSLKALALSTNATDAATMVKAFDKNLKNVIVTTDALLFGRINSAYLNASQKMKLAELALLSLSASDDAAFVEKTVDFFHDVTAGRYQFKTLENGKFRPALQNVNGRYNLSYPEFTAVYPNGSVLEWSSDRDGNRITKIREPGMLHFVQRNYHDVDHIRTEPFYGYIPKMDYTYTGNGIHNPAVRTWLPSSKYRGLYKTLNITDKKDDTLWIVSRGAVSHGCTRMAAGHIEEIRNVFPSNPRVMPKVPYFGNNSADYDVFDIDADGKAEIMGVTYFIAYKLVSNTGDGYREADGLINESFDRTAFYAQLYGNRQYKVDANGEYVFTNPYMTYFSGVPTAERAAAFSQPLKGEYKLYEQAYEKDKIQFYNMPTIGIGSLDGNNTSNRSVQFVRLFGRINDCGPFAGEFKGCAQNAFQQEMNSLLSVLR